MKDKKNESIVLDLMPSLRREGKDLIERGADAFLQLYKVVGVEEAFEFMNTAIQIQFREQILRLAEEKMDKEEQEQLREAFEDATI